MNNSIVVKPWAVFGVHHFYLFLGSCLILNLTPGPDTLYILGRGMAQGRKAGVASALGIGCGALVHTLAAACGLSALLASSAHAFTAVKFAGALYMVYLGSKMLLSRTEAAVPAGFSNIGFGAVFRQGLLTNVLNPKVALFFLAFMPQFIAAESQDKFEAFLLLGLTFVTTGTLWCLCLAWFSSLIGDQLRRGSRFAAGLNRAAGTLFVALGIRLALTR